MLLLKMRLGCEPRNQFCDSFAFSSGKSGTQLLRPTHSKFPRDGRKALFHSYGVHLGGVFMIDASECFCDGCFHRLISNLCFLKLYLIKSWHMAGLHEY